MERRVELFAAIRFDWQRYRMPVRALARKYDVHRRTVRQAIASPVPPDRKVPVRAAPVREAVAGWIDEMLAEDLAAPRKQRHTARRVFERLADEHDAQVSYSYVARYVARRRAEIAAEDRDGAAGVAGFVPQVREPGAEALCGFPHRASYAACANMRRQVRQRLSCRWLRVCQCRIFTGFPGRRAARRGAGTGLGGCPVARSWRSRPP
jgi:hypothetical protein